MVDSDVAGHYVSPCTQGCAWGLTQTHRIRPSLEPGEHAPDGLPPVTSDLVGDGYGPGGETEGDAASRGAGGERLPGVASAEALRADSQASQLSGEGDGPATPPRRPRGRPSSRAEAKKPAAPSRAEAKKPAAPSRRSDRIRSAAAAKAGETMRTANLTGTRGKARGKRTPGGPSRTGMAPRASNEWEIERIVDSRIEAGTLKHFYLVKWKGFAAKDNTWEPKRNLTNCAAAIRAYERAAAKGA